MTRLQRRGLYVLGAIIAIFGVVFRLSISEPVIVDIQPAALGKVEQTVANTRAGTVQACRRSKLSPSSGGQIANLPVREGDQVESNQELMTLWNKDLQAQLKLTQSEAQATMDHAQAACLQADRSHREAQRLVQLQKSGAISEERVDNATTAALSSAADCQAAKAQINVSQARIKVAQANLERTVLRAPFAGVIAEINGELNEYVTPSPPGIPTPPVIDLIDNRCFYVIAPIDEVDAAKIAVQMPVRITLDAFDRRIFHGRVRRIAAYVLDLEKQARTVDVEVEFNQPDDADRLLAGYSADVEIITMAHDSVVRVPSEAIMNGNQVYILNKASGKIEMREIETGLANWDYTEILKGLETGDQVITSIAKHGVQAGAYAQPDNASKDD